MVIIKTKEFTLRPIKLTDAQGYIECHQDKDAKKNFFSVPTTITEAKKELRKEKLNKKFAIEIKGEFAGFISLKLSDVPRYKHTATISYGLHKEYRGKGLATKAVKTITKYGFKELQLKRISGWCRTFNKASARVLEKSGYAHEGTLRKNKYINGKYLDDMIWAKVK